MANAVAADADHARTCMGLFDSAMHTHMGQSHTRILLRLDAYMHIGQSHMCIGLSHTRIL